MVQASKATEREKEDIRELFRQGLTREDVMSRYPEMDGRVISGLYLRFQQTEHPSAPGAGGPGPALPAGSEPQPPLPPPMEGTPIAHGPVNGTPAAPAGRHPAQAPDNLGFMPVGQGTTTDGGFKPYYREYFIIQKIDGADQGIKGREYPPFRIENLMVKYPPGEYEIQHYKDGRYWQSYRNTIAPQNVPQVNRETPAAAAAVNPIQPLIQAMDVAHRIEEGARRTAREEAHAREAALAAAAAQKNANEGKANEGMLELVKEVIKKPDPPKENMEAKVLEKYVLMQTEDRKTSEERHRLAMQEMENRQRLSIEAERERHKMEMDRFREEQLSREKMNNQFMEKIQELDNDRQALFKESYDKMTGEIGAMQENVMKNADKALEHQNEIFKLQQQHIKEMSDARMNIKSGDREIEVAKIVRDGLVAGMDRVGARIDSLVEHGVIKGADTKASQATVNRTQGVGGQTQMVGSGTQQTRTANQEKPVSIKQRIAEFLKTEDFTDLKDSILSTVKKRKAIMARTEIPEEKRKLTRPHGDVIASTFVDKINNDPSLKPVAAWLISHTWDEILLEIGPSLSEEEKTLLSTDPEAISWWDEFNETMTWVWNQARGITTQ